MMLSGGEETRKAKQEQEAVGARAAAEEEAVRSVVEGSMQSFEDGRYGLCARCKKAVAIPGVSHSLCVSCGWVQRAVKNEDEKIELGGHHD